MFKNLSLILLYLFLFSSFCFSQAPYNYKMLYLPGTAATIDNGMMGAINPANAFYNRSQEVRYYWTNIANSSDDYYHGYISGFKGISFSMFQEKQNENKVNDYTLSLGKGNEMFSIGSIYGWSSGDRATLMRKTYAGAGLIFRPNSVFSIGGLYNVFINSKMQFYALDAGIRPFGNKKLTIFAGTDFSDKDKFRNYNWQYGAKFELFNGLGVIARLDNNHSFNIGFNISLGIMSFSSFNRFNRNDDKVYDSHMIRVGGMEKSTLYEKLFSRKLLKMEMKGRVQYRSYQIFRPEGKRFYEIIENINNAAKSSQVSTLAINLSGMKVGAEKAWEIREALQKFKNCGKKLIIYIDRADMTLYHLASVADLLVLDPEGQLFLKGYIMTRTYFKGTLEKLGLAFDEWRFFKYKSAAEALSRDSMSDADREQRQKFLDDLYLTVKNDIISTRKISGEQFDQIIDEKVILLPDEAKEKGMVDYLGRWSKIDEIIEDNLGEKAIQLPGLVVNQYMEVDERWGEEPQVAIVYALGECAMDNGINARKLEKQLLGLAKKRNVKAIVLRVVSPGGDGLASDLVAEAIKTCRKSKPVIISQGAVAASGGYWISMYGDSILASPLTVTASIGVIGGWIYDKGLTQKLGLTSDLVKVGKHADFGTGASIPFLGQVPARNLTSEEWERMSTTIQSMYKNFVKKVADGRGLEYDYVEKHAQGRIYSGLDGKRYKLIDKLGGLQDAVELAIKMAGLQNKKVDIVEYGKYLGLFPFPSFNMIGLKSPLEFSDPATRYYLTFPLKNHYQPMLMVNPESVKIR